MGGKPKTVWKLIIDLPLPGPLNMAIDEVLLHRLDDTPILRLYQWSSPTVSLGMAQQLHRHVNLEFCQKNDISVVRRITGGKAVLHDKELTYCLCGPINVPPFSKNLLDTYCEIGKAFCEALQPLEIKAEMASRRQNQPQSALSSCFANASSYEILASGKKLLGSAQKRTRNRVLQHGSLLMEYDSDNWKAIFLKHNPNLEDQVTDLETEAGKAVSMDMLIRLISDGFSKYFDIAFELDTLSKPELTQAHELAEKAYFDLIGDLDSKVN